MYGWSCGTEECLVIVIVNRYTRTIFENFVIICMEVFDFHITGNLPLQSCFSNIFRCVLPYTISLEIPYLPNRSADKPVVRGVCSLAILIIVIIDMIDPVVVQRETDSGVPGEIFLPHIVGCQRNFKPLFCTSKVRGDRSKSVKLGRR